MNFRSLKSIALLSTCLVSFGFASTAANASFIVTSAVGGVPTGVNYVNFDNLPLGSAGGSSGGVSVSFGGAGQVVIGASIGIDAPPFISASNGALFGDPTVAGQDTTKYISTRIGSATLIFPANQRYLGLLWGSVDAFNNLEFFLGSTSVGTVNGTDVFAAAPGDLGIFGTYYANIVSSLDFNRVVATSSKNAFEFDNVAYNPTDPTKPVPEPLSLGLVGLGVFGIGMVVRRRKAKTAS